MKAVALCLLLAIPAAAQHHDNVIVEVVEEPVYVIGPDGAPIRGLTKDAFDLRVNGRRQPIDYFEAIDASGEQPATAAQPVQRTPRVRRLYLLLFDQLYSNPSRLARAQRAAEALVERSDPQQDYFAVASYTGNKGVQFVTAFLSDRVAVRRAITTLSIAGKIDPFGMAMSASERAEWGAAGESSTPATKYGEEAEDMINGGAANQDMIAQRRQAVFDDLLMDFADLAGRLSGLEGQKHVLLFSEGTTAMADSPVPASPMAGGGSDARTARLMQEMFEKYRAAGVFLDSIDIRGIRHAHAKLGTEANADLQAFAHNTGGEFVHNRNDLPAALSDLTKLHRVVYMLAFHRRSARAGGISVHVSGVPRGTRVSYRQGFGKASPPSTVDPLQLADIIINDIPQTGVRMKLGVQSRDLILSMEKDDVMPQLKPKTPFVDVVLYVFDRAGAAVLTKNMRFDPRTEPLLFRQTLDLPAGGYTAKAVASIAGTTSVGFARADFTVP